MPANVSVVVIHGAAPGTATNTVTGVSDTGSLGATPHLRLKTADNSTVDLVDPIVVPAAGTNNSFDKWTTLWAGLGPTGSVSNVRFFTDSSYYNLASSGGVATGDLYVLNKPGYTIGSTTSIAGSSSANYTSGAPLTLPGQIPSGAAPLASGSLQKIQQQLAVKSTAVAGLTGTATITLRYDET